MKGLPTISELKTALIRSKAVIEASGGDCDYIDRFLKYMSRFPEYNRMISLIRLSNTEMDLLIEFDDIAINKDELSATMRVNRELIERVGSYTGPVIL